MSFAQNYLSILNRGQAEVNRRASEGLAEARFRESQETVRFNQAKSVVDSLTQSYRQTKSPALQQSIRETMRGYYSVLPNSVKGILIPYINRSPISEEAEKGAIFDQLYTRPKVRGYSQDVNIGGGGPFQPGIGKETGRAETESGTVYTVTEMITDPQAYNESLYDIADHEERKRIFMLGEAAGKVGRKNFIHYAEGKASVRTKSGQIVLYDKNDIALTEAAEKTGISKDKIWAAGGNVPSGKPYQIVDDKGNILTKETSRNVFTGEESEAETTKITPAKKIPGLPNPAVTLLNNIMSGNKTNLQAKYYHGLLEDVKESGSGNDFSKAMSLLYPSWHFPVLRDPEGKIGIDRGFSWFSGSNYVQPFQGDPVIIEGQEVWITPSGEIVNDLGEHLADTIEEVAMKLRGGS